MAVCKRCGDYYEDPTPTITNPKTSNDEIATAEFCAKCNRAVMMYTARDRSSFFDKNMVDPMKHGAPIIEETWRILHECNGNPGGAPADLPPSLGENSIDGGNW